MQYYWVVIHLNYSSFFVSFVAGKYHPKKKDTKTLNKMELPGIIILLFGILYLIFPEIYLRFNPKNNPVALGKMDAVAYKKTMRLMGIVSTIIGCLLLIANYILKN